MLASLLPAAIGWIPALGPVLLGLAALLPARRAASGCVRAAGATLVVALACAAGVAVHGPFATGTAGVAGIGFSLYLDALSATMFALVAFIGFIVVAYSATYLQGDPRQPHFMRRLALTIASVLLVVISGNLFALCVWWTLASVTLDGLLRYFGDRPYAVLTARKRFVIARIGELFLVAAALLVYARVGSLEYAAVFADARAGALSPVLSVASICIVIAALLQSAQFPLHGWLTEVMEAPTPVSALLHAGIVNAGGFLVLRFVDLTAHSLASLELLAIVGGFTALFGSIVMLTQTSIKASLAYSTVAQMGFMMLECGLCAFPAALLHIVAHSFYKAHAFLSSGSVIGIARASWTPSAGVPQHVRGIVIATGLICTVAVLALAAHATPFSQPGVFVLGIVASLGIAHLLASGIFARPSAYVIVVTAGAAVLVAAAYVALQALTAHVYAPVLADGGALHGPVAAGIAIVIASAFAVVAYVQSLLPASGGSLRWRRAYALLSNGLYVNTYANRLLLRVWPSAGRAVSEEVA